MWGVVDQLVHENIRRNLEAEGAYGSPGILTITIDAVGELTAYHNNLFIGSLRQDQVVLRETDALRCSAVEARITPSLNPIAERIAETLNASNDKGSLTEALFDEWSNVLTRLCIGVRRAGTGGAFLITPAPIERSLDIANRFHYSRLRDSTILRVLDEEYSNFVTRIMFEHKSAVIPSRLVHERNRAVVDAEDRRLEQTGAVKLVSSLATLDGLVLLDPTLAVVGFGVKILSGRQISTIYKEGKRARKFDASHLGTRHTSMLRYCQVDRQAIGVVISQDGKVRMIMSMGARLTLWDNVKLLGYEDDVRAYAAERKRWEAYRQQHIHLTRLGYTHMPKTIDALMSNKGAREAAPAIGRSRVKSDARKPGDAKATSSRKTLAASPGHKGATAPHK